MSCEDQGQDNSGRFKSMYIDSVETKYLKFNSGQQFSTSHRIVGRDTAYTH